MELILLDQLYLLTFYLAQLGSCNCKISKLLFNVLCKNGQCVGIKVSASKHFIISLSPRVYYYKLLLSLKHLKRLKL